MATKGGFSQSKVRSYDLGGVEAGVNAVDLNRFVG
jgi:hypothetical protein